MMMMMMMMMTMMSERLTTQHATSERVPDMSDRIHLFPEAGSGAGAGGENGLYSGCCTIR